MPTEEKKGITIKIDAELHAQVKAYIEANGLTMAEFATRALDNELNPRQQIGGNTMENMKTLAYKVPESLFQQIKEYLHRNHMTQKQFVIGLNETKLKRDLAQTHGVSEISEPDVSDDVSSQSCDPEENNEKFDDEKLGEESEIDNELSLSI